MDLHISPQNYFLHLVPGVVKLLTCLWHFLPFCVTYLSTSSRAVSLLVTSSHNTMIGDHVQLLVRDSSDVSVQACVSPLSPFRKLVLVKWNGTHLAQPFLVLYVMLSLVLCWVDCSLNEFKWTLFCYDKYLWFYQCCCRNLLTIENRLRLIFLFCVKIIYMTNAR